MKDGMVVVSPKGKRYIMLRLGVGVHYREKDGKAVLRDQTSWRKLAGIWINTPWGCVWLHFRRWRYKGITL
jgi:hypothetical protein